MFKIDLESIHPYEIEQMCTNARTYKRGESYFFDENVKNIKYYQAEKKVTAMVEGSRAYNCTVIFNSLGEVKQYSCTCEAFATYAGACKHLAATMLEIYERHSHRMFQEQGATTHHLIDAFKETFRSQPLLHRERRDRLHIHFELIFKENPFQQIIDQVELRIRAGTQRPYVVKNVEDFLYAVENEFIYTFTPKFEFDPEVHYVSDQDWKILQQLLKIQGIMRNPSSTRMTWSYEDKADRLVLPEVLFPDLLALLEKAEHLAYNDPSSGGTSLIIADMVPSDLTFLLQVTDQNNAARLTLKDAYKYTLFLKEFRAVLYGAKLLKLTEEQAAILETLFAEAEDVDHIAQFPKSQLEDFCSYVLPRIERVGNVQIEEEITQLLQQYPLQATLYLDLNGEVLTATLSFQYGNETINPLSNLSSERRETILIRDVEKEETILALLQESVFEQEKDAFVARGEGNIVDILFEVLPSLEEHVDIFSTAGVKGIITSIDTPPTVSLSTNEQLNWLDLSFSFEGIPEEEVDRLLQALLQNKKYYRLTSGSFLHLEGESFEGIREAVKQFAPEKGKVSRNMSVPLYKALVLEEDSADLYKLSESLKQLIDNVKNPDFIQFEQPEAVQAELRQYQLTGFRWLKALSQFGLGGILADDMGLGKTLQAITYLQSMSEEDPAFRALVIAPASLLYNWKKELERFAPDLKAKVIAGTKAEREEMVQESEEALKAHVWITSYPLIQRDVSLFEGRAFHTLILDEAQAIKNDAAKTTKAVRSLHAASTFALSGTPIENRLEELYAIFHTIMPGLLGSKKGFKALERAEIAKRVRPFILRRMKKDVLQELPDKIEQVQYTELTDEQKMMYLAQVKRLAKDVDRAMLENRFQEKRMQILAGLTMLRQICCHPQLLLPAESHRSGKFERLLELVQEGLEGEQRMVIFSQFTSMLALIRQEFEKRGWAYHYLDGSTPARQRVELADRFNAGEHSLFLISMKAGGTGLNLTGGDTVILFDTWWNPAVEDQAADRVYRYGQKKTVQVLKLITTGTIEEKMLALHEKKKALVEEIIQPGDQALTSLKLEDIKELLQV